MGLFDPKLLESSLLAGFLEGSQTTKNMFVTVEQKP